LSTVVEDEEDVEDPVLVERATRYFVGNIFSFFVCMLAGLLGLMFLPGAVRVLSLTNKSDNPLRVRVYSTPLTYGLATSGRDLNALNCGSELRVSNHNKLQILDPKIVCKKAKKII
jgi:hypothetical protein